MSLALRQRDDESPPERSPGQEPWLSRADGTITERDAGERVRKVRPRTPHRRSATWRFPIACILERKESNDKAGGQEFARSRQGLWRKVNREMAGFPGPKGCSRNAAFFVRFGNFPLQTGSPGRMGTVDRYGHQIESRRKLPGVAIPTRFKSDQFGRVDIYGRTFQRSPMDAIRAESLYFTH